MFVLAWWTYSFDAEVAEDSASCNNFALFSSTDAKFPNGPLQWFLCRYSGTA